MSRAECFQATYNLSPATTGGSLHQGNLLKLPNSNALDVAVPAPARCGPSVVPGRSLDMDLSGVLAFVATISKPRGRSAPRHDSPLNANALAAKQTKTPPTKI